MFKYIYYIYNIFNILNLKNIFRLGIYRHHKWHASFFLVTKVKIYGNKI